MGCSYYFIGWNEKVKMAPHVRWWEPCTRDSWSGEFSRFFPSAEGSPTFYLSTKPKGGFTEAPTFSRSFETNVKNKFRIKWLKTEPKTSVKHQYNERKREHKSQICIWNLNLDQTFGPRVTVIAYFSANGRCRPRLTELKRVVCPFGALLLRTQKRLCPKWNFCNNFFVLGTIPNGLKGILKQTQFF